jgi:hypothetical protein
VNVLPDSELAEEAIGLPDGRVVSVYAQDRTDGFVKRKIQDGL